MAELKRDDSFDAQLLPNLHSAAWGTIIARPCKTGAQLQVSILQGHAKLGQLASGT